MAKRKARRTPKQKAATRKLVALNKRRGGKSRRRKPGKRKAYGRKRKTAGRRRNPGVAATARKMSSGYLKSITDLPKTLPKLLKGKNLIRNGLYATGGVAVSMVGGSLVQRAVMPWVEKIPWVGQNLSGSMTQRILGGIFASGTTFLTGNAVFRKEADRTAFIAGGATGALIEIFFPGVLGRQMAKIPVVGPYIGYSSPVMGLAAYYGSNELAAYVEAPAYQGVGQLGAYVEAPAYQGVGQLGAYVEAPAYQGVGHVGEYVEAPGYQSSSAAGDRVLSGLGVEMDYGRNDLAGIGSNMASFLDSPVH